MKNEGLAEERNELVSDLQQNPDDVDAQNRISEIDQTRFNWLEYYKVKFEGTWFTEIAKDLVLRPKAEFGFFGVVVYTRVHTPRR